MVPPTPPGGRARSLRRLTQWVIGSSLLGSPLAILAFVNAVWGPPWPKEPSFSPGSPSFSSALDVPFIVTNKSSLFDLSNLTIECRLLNFRAEGRDGSVIAGGNSSIAARGVNPILRHLSSGPFVCPLRGLMGAGRADAADRVVKARIQFISEYDGLVWGRARVMSSTFSLNTSTIPPQWMPGDPLR
jgi:hypothetical protein